LNKTFKIEETLDQNNSTISNSLNFWSKTNWKIIKSWKTNY